MSANRNMTDAFAAEVSYEHIRNAGAERGVELVQRNSNLPDERAWSRVDRVDSTAVALTIPQLSTNEPLVFQLSVLLVGSGQRIATYPPPAVSFNQDTLPKSCT